MGTYCTQYIGTWVDSELTKGNLCLDITSAVEKDVGY